MIQQQLTKQQRAQDKKLWSEDNRERFTVRVWVRVGTFDKNHFKKLWSVLVFFLNQNIWFITLLSEMSGLALSNGSLLNVFQGKRSYQPVWQVRDISLWWIWFIVRYSGDLHLLTSWTKPVSQLCNWQPAPSEFSFSDSYSSSEHSLLIVVLLGEWWSIPDIQRCLAPALQRDLSQEHLEGSE